MRLILGLILLIGAWLSIKHQPFGYAMFLATIVLSFFGFASWYKATAIHTDNTIIEKVLDGGAGIVILMVSVLFFVEIEYVKAAPEVQEYMVYLGTFFIISAIAGIIISVVNIDLSINREAMSKKEK